MSYIFTPFTHSKKKAYLPKLYDFNANLTTEICCSSYHSERAPLHCVKATVKSIEAGAFSAELIRRQQQHCSIKMHIAICTLRSPMTSERHKPKSISAFLHFTMQSSDWYTSSCKAILLNGIENREDVLLLPGNR